MRFVRVVLALVFGLAAAGPETHACPVHSATPVPAHHQGAGSHQKATHCTCPQACCPAAVSLGLPSGSVTWTAETTHLQFSDHRTDVAVLLLSNEHAHPFALAPPQLLA